MPDRVVDEIPHGAGEQPLGSAHPNRGDPRSVDPDGAESSYAARLGKDEIVEIDIGGDGAARRSLVEPCQQQQTVDDVLHAQPLREHHLGEFPGRSGVRPCAGQFGVLAHGGERRAQFVRSIADEALTGAIAVFDAVEHAVHGAGEPIDLVASACARNALVEAVAADLIDPAPNPLDGPQSPRCDEPHHDADERDPDRHCHGQHRRGGGDRIADVLGRAGDHERPFVGLLGRDQHGFAVDASS